MPRNYDLMLASLGLIIRRIGKASTDEEVRSPAIERRGLRILVLLSVENSRQTVRGFSTEDEIEMADHSPKYTLDEALASVGFGNFQGLALAYAGVGWISDAMEMMLLSFIGPAVQSDWKLSPTEESLLSTVVFAGMLVGSYFWGLVSDSYGRRKGILGSLMVTVGAGILSACAPNYVSLVILRCLLGFGVGGGQIFALWFIEFVPTQNRGSWMILYSSFWTFGTIIEASLGWIVMPRLGWRGLVGFSMLPSLSVLLFSGFIPESPRYLCVKGRTIEAQNVLEEVSKLNRAKLPPGILISDQRMELDEEHAPSEETPLLSSAGEKKTHSLKSFSLVLTLFSSKLITITLPLWFFYFGNLFLYYGIVLMTSELSSGKSMCRNFTELSVKKSTNLYINVFVTSLAETPGLIFSAIMVDKIGRKVTMKITCLLGFLVLLPLISHQNEMVTTALLFGARMFIMGTYAVLCTYSREVYPTSVRSVGVGVASAVGRIGGMICPFVAVGLVRGCHQAAAVVLFEVLTVLLGLCVLLFPFDTRGRKLTDTILDHQ